MIIWCKIYECQADQVITGVDVIIVNLFSIGWLSFGAKFMSALYDALNSKGQTQKSGF